jgi:hypothetical protein
MQSFATCSKQGICHKAFLVFPGYSQEFAYASKIHKPHNLLIKFNFLDGQKKEEMPLHQRSVSQNADVKEAHLIEEQKVGIFCPVDQKSHQD